MYVGEADAGYNRHQRNGSPRLLHPGSASDADPNCCAEAHRTGGWQSPDAEVLCKHVTTATQTRGIEDSKLAIIVVMTGAVTLTACIAWAISRGSGLANVSGEDVMVAPVVLMVGLVPFVVLAFGAVMLGRAITMVATTLFALVIVAAYWQSSDSSTAIGHPIRASTTLLVVAVFALIGVSEGVRALRRHRSPA